MAGNLLNVATNMTVRRNKSHINATPGIKYCVAFVSTAFISNMAVVNARIKIENETIAKYTLSKPWDLFLVLSSRTLIAIRIMSKMERKSIRTGIKLIPIGLSAQVRGGPEKEINVRNTSAFD